ncbi:MAG: hypothetical protein LUF86_00450 [Clostridiales bacterium]|nr:hypothetical protein [Clostridiales bacterium]
METKDRTDLQAAAIRQLKTGITRDVSTSFPGRTVNASLIYNNLVIYGRLSITPPKEPPTHMEYLTMDPLRNYRGGSSIKPGNISLNMRKLVESVPDVITIGAGMASDHPIIIVCGALSICRKLRNIATVKVEKEQAFVIVALWKNCNPDHSISPENGFEVTNKLLNRYGESEITNIKYNHIIDSLEKMQCIELEDNAIWLKEWISDKYINMS